MPSSQQPNAPAAVSPDPNAAGDAHDGNGVAAPTTADGWVGTWGTPLYTPKSSIDLSKQTLRQIVYTSIGGTAARVCLSNVSGESALGVQAIYLANAKQDGTVDTATQQQVTFANGNASVSVPKGQEACSDSVDFAVLPLSNVAVSFYVTSSPPTNSYHYESMQNNYRAQGGMSSNAVLTAATTYNNFYFLRRLDVKNAAATGAVSIVAASITNGDKSTIGANMRWPNMLARRLSDANMTVGVLNYGIPAGTFLFDGDGLSAVNRFKADGLSAAGVRWVIVCDLPINDIIGHATTDLNQKLMDGLKGMVRQAHAANVRIYCPTLTPFGGSSNASAFTLAEAKAYNAFVQSADSGCDGSFDFNAATRDPANPSQYAASDDSGDHVHPSDTGRQHMANAVDLASFQ